MRLLQIAAHPERSADMHMILLPGALQQPEAFLQAGFADAVRQRGLSLDLTLVDLGIEHIGEATDSELLQRIDTQLVQPARCRGQGSLWLGGISIGGLIALGHAARHPQQVDGLCLLSPYPGNRILLREIDAAGGLAHWCAATVVDAKKKADGDTDIDTDADTDTERSMWRWLQNTTGQPRIHLGYGTGDRFADGLHRMAQALQPQHDHQQQRVDTVAGGHDWPTWLRLWENFLETLR